MNRVLAAQILGLALGVASSLAPGLVSEARAVEVALETPSTITITPGASFTIEIAIDNASMDPVNGIAVDITGLAGHVIATSGVSSAGYFFGFCTITYCFGGIRTSDALFFNTNDLAGGGVYVPGNDSIRVVSALTLSDVTADGSWDPGVAGVVGEHDPTDVHLVLQDVFGLGSYDLMVVSSFNSQAAGETILAPLTVTVNVVPEPAAALLLGLGLAGLAAASRRNPGRAPSDRLVRTPGIGGG